MKIQIIILILIANFAFGQEKVTIDQDIVKYEIKDEFNRFDNIANELKNYKSLDIDIDKSSINILNRYSTGFTGHTISVIIDKKMNIVKANYEYWSDVAENGTEYKVDSIDLILNQNPFEKIKGLRGQYTMQVKKVSANGELLEKIIFKGKFKTFKGIDKLSSDYLWALEQNKLFYGLTNENGVYLNPDIRPKLKSNIKDLVLKLKELSALKIPEFRVWVVITEDGKIERESIRFSSSIYNDKLKNSITDILFEKIEFYPACMNEIAVKSKLPMRIRLE